jgi:hypothetical protein
MADDLGEEAVTVVRICTHVTSAPFVKLTIPLIFNHWALFSLGMVTVAFSAHLQAFMINYLIFYHKHSLVASCSPIL